MSSLINMLTGKGNNNDSRSAASSSSMSSTSSSSMSSTNSGPMGSTTTTTTSGPMAAGFNDGLNNQSNTAYNTNTHTAGYSNSGYGTSGAGAGTATGIAGHHHHHHHNHGSAAAMSSSNMSSSNMSSSNMGTSNVGTDGYITRSEEQLRVGKEAFESGRAQIGKHVTTEQVSTSVPISKERVVVEREPITSADIQKGNLNSDIGDASYEVRLKEERAIAEKEVVPIEKVRLRKEVETTQQQVGADLRKEHIDVNDGVNTSTKTDTYNTYGTAANSGYGTASSTTTTTTGSKSTY